ncbi:hypothetical protein D9M71_475420 [compost metagenome]
MVSAGDGRFGHPVRIAVVVGDFLHRYPTADPRIELEGFGEFLVKVSSGFFECAVPAVRKRVAIEGRHHVTNDIGLHGVLQ